MLTWQAANFVSLNAGSTSVGSAFYMSGRFVIKLGSKLHTILTFPKGCPPTLGR